MAKHDATWTRETGDGPVTKPETRQDLLQGNRDRRQSEPAAAPQETDSETGTPYAVPLSARTEPVRTHAVAAAETGQHDVRVGPGDAGAADTPRRAPERVPGRNDSWRRALKIVALLVVFGVIVSLLMAA